MKQTKWIHKGGIGRTGWTEFAIIAAFVVALALTALFSDEPAVRWAAGTFAVLIPAVFVYGTSRNIKGKQG